MSDQCPFNSWDALKLLAMVLMFTDHVGYFFAKDEMLWRCLGQGTAPIFLFLTGYARSHRIKADLLVGFVILWAINAWLKGSLLPANFLAALILGRLLVARLDSGRMQINKPFEWMGLMVLFCPTFMLFQLGTLAFNFVLLGYMLREKERFSHNTRLAFLIAAFAIHFVLEKAAHPMSGVEAAVMIATFTAVGAILWKFRVEPVQLHALARPFEPVLRFAARHMLWIYVIHFGALQLITGVYY